MASLLLKEYVEKIRKVDGETTDIWLCDQVVNGFLEDSYDCKCDNGKMIIFVENYRFAIKFGSLSTKDGNMVHNILISLYDNDTNQGIYIKNTYRTTGAKECEIF